MLFFGPLMTVAAEIVIEKSGIYIYIYIHTVFITERFFKVAIESWPEWDVNPQPLTATPISSFVQFQFSFRLLPSSVATFVQIEICLMVIT